MPDRGNYGCGKAGGCTEQIPPPPESVFKQTQSVLHFAGTACLIIVWCYNTFALKETVGELKNMVANVEVRCNNYSDHNRQRVEDKFEGIITDIRDQLKDLHAFILKRTPKED